MRRFAAPYILLLALSILATPFVPRADPLSDAHAEALELYRANRVDEALPHFEMALSLAEQRFGPTDPRISVELNNLAEAYRVLGRYDEAEPLYERAVELDEGNLGTDDPDLATSLNNLALLYRAQNRLTEAEQLYERSLDILEHTLGPRHPNVAKSLNNLAVLYDIEGKRDQARPLIEQALDIARETMGDDHPTTVTLERNLETMSSSPIETVDSEPFSDVQPAAGGPLQVDGDDNYAIHLSSVRTVDAANAEWARLKKSLKLPSDWPQRTPERIETKDKGTFYRVAGGSFATHELAVEACDRIRTQGQYCGVLTR
ncbi:MAG: tetratricopeptide repeat protein [Geminicoccaceae bacterium]|nr:tetratricopeptide repeat protein [Geminicoccaceae bacterium]